MFDMHLKHRHKLLADIKVEQQALIDKYKERLQASGEMGGLVLNQMADVICLIGMTEYDMESMNKLLGVGGKDGKSF